jgi:hypothetical protein
MTEVFLSMLLQDLEKGSFSFLETLQPDWWSNVIKMESGVYKSPRIGEFHRKIVHQLVKHNKVNELDPHTELFFFSTTHWTLILLEAIHLNHSHLQKDASESLGLYSHRKAPMFRIMSVLLTYGDSRDFVSFFEWCKKTDERWNLYRLFTTELLREMKVWTTDDLPISSTEYANMFEEKFSSIVDYISKMYEEENIEEIMFTEVFGNLREKIRKRKIESHAEYVIAEMVLQDKVQKDIMKYVLKSYIET